MGSRLFFGINDHCHGNVIGQLYVRGIDENIEELIVNFDISFT